MFGDQSCKSGVEEVNLGFKQVYIHVCQNYDLDYCFSHFILFLL